MSLGRESPFCRWLPTSTAINSPQGRKYYAICEYLYGKWPTVSLPFNKLRSKFAELIIKLSSSNKFFSNRCVKINFCIEKTLMFPVLHFLIKCLATKIEIGSICVVACKTFHWKTGMKNTGLKIQRKIKHMSKSDFQTITELKLLVRV